jgi:hypothetical protein
LHRQLSSTLFILFSSVQIKVWDSSRSNMPSQVVAGPRGLEDEVAESTASLTHNKEDIPLPVLQEVEVVYDIDYVLDCQGRQRFDREANDQHYYIGQPEDPSPSYLDFPMPGQVSADTLRDFLRQNLRPDQVVDEYGTQCGITAVSNDHLLTLQAKLWVKIPGSRSLVKPTTQRPSRSQNPIAGHVLKISQRLKGNQPLSRPIPTWLISHRETRVHTQRGL